ncbi:response regulator [Pseudoalteromonas rhizosphaerae]|uniref:response regulator n=1 Tax=Pseudoalteromonas rhizosphaerae TaxID=2518973 RepID=UPI00384FA4BC
MTIIEDNLELAALLKSFFEKHGFLVNTIYSGSSGLEYVLLHQPDFVLLDLMLPEVDGFEVCRALQNKYFGKVIILRDPQK